MRRQTLFCIAYVVGWQAVAQTQPHIIDALTYNTIPIEIDGRHYTASASVDRYSDGSAQYSFVIVFPADKYLVHTVGVEHGITTFTAHGHTYHIVGRRVALTDYSAAHLKLLPGELPRTAYASSSALQAAVTKFLKKTHAAL